jgi:hypothetical protein
MSTFRVSVPTHHQVGPCSAQHAAAQKDKEGPVIFDLVDVGTVCAELCSPPAHSPPARH